MKRAESVRRAYERDYPRASTAFIAALVELDEQMYVLYPARDWVGVVRTADEWLRRARLEMPVLSRMLEQVAFEYVSQAYEAMGENEKAISALKAALRLRTRTGSRASTYERLVALLVVVGRKDEAYWYANHGFRYSRARDSFCAEQLRLRMVELAGELRST